MDRSFMMIEDQIAKISMNIESGKALNGVEVIKISIKYE